MGYLAEQIELMAWLQPDGARARLGLSSEPARVTLVAEVHRSGTNILLDVLGQSLLIDVYYERGSRDFDNYVMRDINTTAPLHRTYRARHVVIKSVCEQQRLDRLPASLVFQQQREAA